MWLTHSLYLPNFKLEANYPGGGVTRSENWWGCAAGRWKLDPKRSREKLNLGPKRSNSVRIGSFNTPKDRFGVGGGEKIPQKDRVQSSECQKRGSKRRHIHITQHRGSTLPGPTNFKPASCSCCFYSLCNVTLFIVLYFMCVCVVCVCRTLLPISFHVLSCIRSNKKFEFDERSPSRQIQPIGRLPVCVLRVYCWVFFVVFFKFHSRKYIDVVC